MTGWTRLAVLAACAFALVALLSWGSDRAIWATLGCGVLCSLAGVEQSLRNRLSR
jgi:hypothetical protein